jgi:aminoglycoside phosphotransferase (APT) family kinase protein
MVPTVKQIDDALRGVAFTIAAELLGQPVRPSRRLEKGFASASWRATAAGGQEVVVKVGLTGDRLDDVVRALELVRDVEVDVPEVLGVRRGDPRLGERHLSVLSWVDGTDLTDALARASALQREVLAATFGSALAKLHTTTCTSFSNEVASAGQSWSHWPDLVTDHMNRLEVRYRRDGAPFDARARRGIGLMAELCDDLRDTRIVPRLAHRDLYADNVVARNGAVVGFIDFDQAKIWDPVADFAKIDLLVFDDAPPLAEMAAAAYVDEAHEVEKFAVRRHLAVGLELLWGRSYFYRTGEVIMAQRWDSHLDSWCRTSVN